MKLREIFRDNVKYYRKERKLSQEKLAELSDISVNYVGSIERSSRKVTIDTIEKIAHGLEISAIDLLTERNHK